MGNWRLLIVQIWNLKIAHLIPADLQIPTGAPRVLVPLQTQILRFASAKIPGLTVRSNSAKVAIPTTAEEIPTLLGVFRCPSNSSGKTTGRLLSGELDVLPPKFEILAIGCSCAHFRPVGVRPTMWRSNPKDLDQPG